jgi:glycosyltransferase involved in cell wall biosynthesis
MINLKVEALVSVIIPCYNHGRYLSKAIESVLTQTYTHFEIIVVDDGSNDETKEIAQNYKEVKYVYQMNQGLSAARNTGIDESTGEYLVFLDADDWLLTDALMINLHFIQGAPQLAFVSGGFRFFFNKDQKMWDEISKVESNHYCHLLQKNFIAMIATVMFQRWVFNSFRYDTTLKVCEDYDLYLRVARRHPIVHHTELIAVYFIHDLNVSKGSAKMLNTALQILDAQKSGLRSAEERQWFNLGQTFWRKWYCTIMRDEMVKALNDTMEANMVTLETLKKHNKQLYFDLILKTFLAFFKVGK